MNCFYYALAKQKIQFVFNKVYYMNSDFVRLSMNDQKREESMLQISQQKTKEQHGETNNLD